MVVADVDNMNDVEIITNMLNNFTGLPDFYIIAINCNKYQNKQPYHIYFSDSINFRFLVSVNEDFESLVYGLYKRYLDESLELGMGTK